MDIAPPRAAGRVYAGNSASGNARVQYGDIHGNVTYNVYEVHRGQIGIEASIFGLRSLTDSIHVQLASITASDPSQPPAIQYIKEEVAASKVSVDAFNYKLSWLHNAPEQAALVKLDQLVILLANAVVLFDRLRTTLDRHMTARDKSYDDLSALLVQLQEHNMVWRLQLELMDRHTESETDLLALNLDSATNKLLLENADLKRRMDAFQVQLDQMSKQMTIAAPSILESAEPRSQEQPDEGESDEASLHSSTSSFEDTLNTSWVYRRNQHRSEVMSIDTSLQRDYAWSEMSELTLANKSALSVLALPIDLSELAHRDWYQESRTQAAGMPTISEEIDLDLDTLAGLGRDTWAKLSEDQILSVRDQLMARTQSSAEPRRKTSSQLSIKRISLAGRARLGRRRVAEQEAIDIIGRDDYQSFRKVWLLYDPKFTGYVSKEAFGRLMGQLPYSFGLRIHAEPFTVRSLLCSVQGYHEVKYEVYGLGLRHLALDQRLVAHFNKSLADLPVTAVQERRRIMQQLYTEIMLTADPDRGISFFSLTFLFAMHRDKTKTFRRDTLESYLRSRLRSQKVEEDIQRQTVIGFFDTLYWSRKFRKHRQDKQQGRITSPSEVGFDSHILQLGDSHSLLREQEFVKRATSTLESDFKRQTLEDTGTTDQDLMRSSASEYTVQGAARMSASEALDSIEEDRKTAEQST